jgi:hypothetical protein
MNTFSAMTIASHRQSEDRREAEAQALARRGGSARRGLPVRRLLHLRGAVSPGAVGAGAGAPQGVETVGSWRLSH